MTSPYGLDRDQASTLEEQIVANISTDSVVNPVKRILQSLCDEACDMLTDYVTQNGEYALVLHDLVRKRAERLVQNLLRGDEQTAEAFCLKERPTSIGPDPDKPFVYDPDGVRAAIVERFKDQIQNAEMIALREKVATLEAELKWRRELQSNRY